MKRIVLLVAIATTVVLAASGLTPDFGVIVTSRGTYDPTVTTIPVPVSPVVRSALWFSLEGASAATGDRIQINGLGSHTFDLDHPAYFDLEQLKMQATFPLGNRTLFDIEVGRFRHREFSGRVLSHNLDGFRIGFRHPVIEARLGVGTSILVFPRSTQILMSKADLSTLLSDELIPGVPRVIASLELLLPESLFGQNINIAAIAQQDIHDPADLVETADQLLDESLGGRLNTYYAGLGLSGTLLPSLYWQSFGYFGTGWTLYHTGSFYDFATILSYLAGGSLRFAIDQPIPFRLELGGTIAAGDADHNAFLEGNTAGNSLAFVPISRRSSGRVFSPMLTNIAIAEAVLAIQPVRELVNLSIAGYGFARPVVAPISEPGVDPTSDARFLGSEIDGRLDLVLFSDLTLSFLGGVFIPWDPAFTAAYSDPEYRVLAELTFSF